MTMKQHTAKPAEVAVCDACHTDPARPGLLTCGPRCAIALAACLRVALRGA